MKKLKKVTINRRRWLRGSYVGDNWRSVLLPPSWDERQNGEMVECGCAGYFLGGDFAMWVKPRDSKGTSLAALNDRPWQFGIKKEAVLEKYIISAAKKVGYLVKFVGKGVPNYIKKLIKENRI